MTDTSILFQPTDIGPLHLKNRIGVAPMTRVSATADGKATAQMAEYYRGFAEGGFDLIFVEATYTDLEYSQCYLHQPGIATDEQAEAWKQIVDAIHAGGGHAVMQLAHAGALHQGRPWKEGSIAPSAVTPKGTQLTFYRGEGGYPTPSEISAEQMAHVRDTFVESAKRAVAVGFDAIELHGANGYLLDQFWTSYTNQRTDEYGGSARNRIRFAEETLKAVIAGINGAVPVGLRLSQSKVNDFEHVWSGGEQDAADIYPVLDAAGVGFIHITEHDATAEVFGSGKSLVALTRQYSKAPIVVNGGLGDPATAAGLVAAGDADVIAQGKSALANPDWPRKVESGEALEEFDFGMFSPLADLPSQYAWLESR